MHFAKTQSASPRALRDSTNDLPTECAPGNQIWSSTAHVLCVTCIQWVVLVLEVPLSFYKTSRYHLGGLPKGLAWNSLEDHLMNFRWYPHGSKWILWCTNLNPKRIIAHNPAATPEVYPWLVGVGALGSVRTSGCFCQVYYKPHIMWITGNRLTSNS